MAILEQWLGRFDERRQILLGVSGLAIALTLLFTYALLPSIRIFDERRATRDLLLNLAVRGQLVGLEVRQASDALAELERDLHGDTANLPENRLESFVIGRLQNISWRNGVELVRVEPSSGDTVLDFRESLFEVELTGVYADLLRWLGDLNGELGFVVIKQFEMYPVEDVAENPRLAAVLTIASYRLAQA